MSFILQHKLNKEVKTEVEAERYSICKNLRMRPIVLATYSARSVFVSGFTSPFNHH